MHPLDLPHRCPHTIVILLCNTGITEPLTGIGLGLEFALRLRLK